MSICLRIECGACGGWTEFHGLSKIKDESTSAELSEWYIDNLDTLCPKCRKKFEEFKKNRSKELYQYFLKKERGL